MTRRSTGPNTKLYHHLRHRCHTQTQPSQPHSLSLLRGGVRLPSSMLLRQQRLLPETTCAEERSGERFFPFLHHEKHHPTSTCSGALRLNVLLGSSVPSIVRVFASLSLSSSFVCARCDPCCFTLRIPNPTAPLAILPLPSTSLRSRNVCSLLCFQTHARQIREGVGRRATALTATQREKGKEKACEEA